jgi:ATP-dependent DNA helicase RecG
LLFSEYSERIKPAFVVKAIRYPGNDIHSTDYLDAEDFTGPLSKTKNHY